jgi:hypothetical protein
MYSIAPSSMESEALEITTRLYSVSMLCCAFLRSYKSNSESIFIALLQSHFFFCNGLFSVSSFAQMNEQPSSQDLSELIDQFAQ